ncbi:MULTISPECIES: hypothetical protein [Pseudoalteromonas]|jgi:hypothetical protein|uniref:Uncharacterized protein n=2 Tax=Pseudoalteromonas TaxID=53246 RepID=A0ABD4EMX2_9GAMM|nr:MULTISPECIES: hypothetical protein [Pseudoalteromonas]KYL34869.1 hypothetical protein A2I96_14880 [Pseudoalteromonas spiralis]MDN3395434.1 hypothetical protein [Pseudoalteromonas sp. APC 3215]MDN3405675.1 hypothetical protein [Pseudoalteromonas sp. APC 3218]MDN3410268.1 hypothetical protein [Pseudoalteromonas sp. APC 3894]MDN3421062.1 hypothetical protein [Pseudoalteromonas sp. APC 3895]
MKKISILMFLVCMLAISYAVYAKSSQTFSAGVIAQEQVYPIKVLALGDFQRCFVVAAQKEDALYSACYIKKSAQSIWVAESAGARCEIKCESHLNSDGKTQVQYFTTDL